MLSERRIPMLPGLTALAEFLPGFEMISWGMIAGPAGLPRPVVERLSALSKLALESPDLVRSYCAGRGGLERLHTNFAICV